MSDRRTRQRTDPDALDKASAQASILNQRLVAEPAYKDAGSVRQRELE
jgi:hypothetical protein